MKRLVTQAVEEQRSLEELLRDNVGSIGVAENVMTLWSEKMTRE